MRSDSLYDEVPGLSDIFSSKRREELEAFRRGGWTVGFATDLGWTPEDDDVYAVAAGGEGEGTANWWGAEIYRNRRQDGLPINFRRFST